MINSKISIDYSRIVIEEIGRKKLADTCNVGLSAISQWLNRGIPVPWAKYLRLRFPRLKCWKNIPEDLVK